MDVGAGAVLVRDCVECTVKGGVSVVVDEADRTVVPACPTGVRVRVRVRVRVDEADGTVVARD